MTKKPRMKRFAVSVKVEMEIGFEISADSIVDAAQKAAAMKIEDIVDFKAAGWDHNDSEAPIVHSVWEVP